MDKLIIGGQEYELHCAGQTPDKTPTPFVYANGFFSMGKRL